MAFVRRKKMHGKHYYQLVRNYREGGRHRQQVLCHLGIHDSVEGAIEGARRRAAHYRDAAADKYKEADLVRRELQANGHAVEGIYNIHSRREAREAVQELRWVEPIRYYYRDEEEWERDKEEWDADMRVAQRRLDYQEALRDAEHNERRRSQQRERLNKLLECQQKYCS
jgi:hypothetical protein